jgi:hypothetical protein
MWYGRGGTPLATEIKRTGLGGWLGMLTRGEHANALPLVLRPFR